LPPEHDHPPPVRRHHADDADLLRRALERDPARVAALFDLAKALSRTHGLGDVLVVFSERAMEITGGFWSSVSAYDGRTGRLTTLVDQGFAGGSEHEGEVFDAADFPATMRVLEQQTAVQIRADSLADDPTERNLLIDMECAAVLMLPLVAHGESIGLFEVYSHVPRTFTDDEVVFCRLLCDVVAAAVQKPSCTRSCAGWPIPTR
jgi:transcriptional regulator with GAF, ATPase, and Fis domain